MGKVRVLLELSGANDIATGRMRSERIDANLDWSIANLALYRNSTLSQLRMNLNGDGRLRHTKSFTLISLTRAAVEFIASQLNLTTLIDQLERGKYGMDEALFSTLNSNLPDFPGGFTTRCLESRGKSVAGVGRYVIWRAEEAKCKSRKFRHTVCIFGAEDLHHLSDGSKVPHLYFNKILPMFDYGAAYCWLKNVGERRGEENAKLDLNFYKSLSHVSTQYE